MFSASYLAGLFDGEGCVFIGRRTNVVKIPLFVLTASINMTHRPMMEALAEQFGGNLCWHKNSKSNPNRRDSYDMMLCGKKARDFLLLIYNEMHLKKEEARIGIIFQAHMDKYKHATPSMSRRECDELVAFRERLRLQLKACKKTPLLGVSDWNAGEFGETPMPDLFGDTEGQYRAKQELATPGVCNEQVPASKEKVCSDLSRDTESTAEMSVPYQLRLIK